MWRRNCQIKSKYTDQKITKKRGGEMDRKFKLMIKGIALLGIAVLLLSCGGGGGGGDSNPTADCVLGTSTLGDCKI